MNNQAAQTFWEIPKNLKYDEPIDETSPLFVDTGAARGHFSFAGLLRSLSVDPNSLEIRSEPPLRSYQLLLGHRGCGKSTELRRLQHRLHDPKRFFVVFLDATARLDINNLGYADILLALAAALLDRLADAEIALSDDYLQPLRAWFDERVEKHERTREYAADLKTGVSGATGLPYVAKLFAAITTSFRFNSTYKEEVRTVVTNSFSEFAPAFNTLIAAAGEQIAREGRGRGLLFIVDGTDRLNQVDSRRFFIGDAYQLRQIEGRFVYCAPIQLANEEGQVQEIFKLHVLPMLKLREKRNPAPLPAAYAAMRELVYRRVARSLFDADTTVDDLIEHSGGNPRHLLRLLDYSFQAARQEILDGEAAREAVKILATEIRRILDSDDYSLLARIDASDEEINGDRVRYLLYNLALLEYNSYWRLTHPAVRTLDAYRRAAAAMTDSAAAPSPP